MKYSGISVVLWLSFWGGALHAELKTGMLLFMQPGGRTFVSVDFSKSSGIIDNNYLSSSIMKDSIPPDSVDMYITDGALVAPNGIVSGGSSFYDSYISKNRTLRVDEECLFYLDSMAKKESLSFIDVQQSGSLKDTVKLYRDDTVFIMKTREDDHVIMFKVYMYIGGIDRYGYYWIYPGSGSRLYKNELISGPDSLLVGVSIFSGRYDPVFKIKNRSIAGELLTKLYSNVNFQLNPDLKTAGLEGFESNSLGLRKVSLYGFGGGSDYPRFEIVKGKVAFLRNQLVSSIYPPVIVNDSLGLIACMVFRCCVEQDLQTADQYGSIRFADLIPDSVRNNLSVCNIQGLWASSTTAVVPALSQNKPVLCSVLTGGNSILLKTEAGMLRGVISNLAGTVLCRFNSRTEGNYSVRFPNRFGKQMLLLSATIQSPDGRIREVNKKVLLDD
ncbi:MAG: hypothetical protein JW915_16945 [Chitinispirillaceae bacterium]|nr:hypothetical protein [Chitinispirillaceae bacterium]